MEGRASPAAIRGSHLLRLALAPTLLITGSYDAIHVGAAAPTLSSELVNQLASPGRMFIPVGTHAQYIQQVDKDENGDVTTKKIMGVSVNITTSLGKIKYSACERSMSC
jgi:hypothetical protein